MATVSIIGTGNMGSGIAALFGRAGASVQTLAHAQASDPIAGDIVVLAVPYTAAHELAEGAERFAGKTVVDISNPVDQATFSPVTFPAGSAAATLQEQLPDAHVLKAFNTNFAATVAAGSVGDNPLSVLVAGDAAEAKQQFVDLVAASGAVAIDAGSLERARELEALGFLQIALAAGGHVGWDHGFALVK